jgi:hypothetical protein
MFGFFSNMFGQQKQKQTRKKKQKRSQKMRKTRKQMRGG